MKLLPTLLQKRQLKKRGGGSTPILNPAYKLNKIYTAISQIVSVLLLGQSTQKLYRKIKMSYSILKSLAEYKYLTFILIHARNVPDHSEYLKCKHIHLNKSFKLNKQLSTYYLLRMTPLDTDTIIYY